MKSLSVIALLVLIFGPFALPQAHADVYANVPEAADYTLVYTLPIPVYANFRDGNPIPYSYNNAESIGLYDRIAYYMELDTGSGTEWVYASMDSFNNHASEIGLPHNIFNPQKYQQIVSNMNVYSNKPGITTGTGITTGNIEMWPSNYNQSNAIGIPGASGSTFDFGDGGGSTSSGHGTFQVHNHGASQVLFAYNDWGGNNTGTPSELGIGNSPSGNIDWTFENTAATYSVKNLQVLVHQVTPPDLPALPTAPSQITTNVSEASDYGLVYQLPISNNNFSPSQYTVDNSASIPDGSFERIGYYVELESSQNGSQYVWVSMDAFNPDASLIGVPNTTEAIQQVMVGDMNVVSNVSGVTEGEGMTGNIEFWNTNYSGNTTGLIPGGTNSYDFNDTRTPGGYGSMQIHNFDVLETIFAYNHWNDPNGISDLGIGNAPSSNTDWTFANNSDIYTLKNLYVLVKGYEAAAVPEPSTVTLAVLALLGMAFFGFRRKS